MASIHKEIIIDARPEDVWDALRDFGALHTRLVPGFVTDTKLDGDARIVTFANGTVAREVLVDIDDKKRRLVYAIKSETPDPAPASAQVFTEATDAAAWCGSPTCCQTKSRPTWTARWISAQLRCRSHSGARRPDALLEQSQRGGGALAGSVHIARTAIPPPAPSSTALCDLSHRSPSRPLLASPRASRLRRFTERRGARGVLP